MPRALISVSDKTGLLAVRPGPGRPGVRARVHRRHRARPRERRYSRHRHLGGHRLSRNHGRPRQDAASGRPRRHPRPARPSRRHGDAWAAQHHPHRHRRRESVSVRDRRRRQPDIAFGALVEEIDIGGPSMVRSAAKNFQDVLVVVDPADYPRVARRARAAGRRRRASSASISRKRRSRTPRPTTPPLPERLAEFDAADGSFARAAAAAGDAGAAVADAAQDQGTALRREPASAGGVVCDRRAASGLGAAEVLQGKELSFTNLLDLDSAARIALEFTEPAAAVIKHTNPCGAAIGLSIEEAYVRAREADPLAAFGGIVGLNRPIDAAAARALVSTFIEAVIAPGVDEEARADSGGASPTCASSSPI